MRSRPQIALALVLSSACPVAHAGWACSLDQAFPDVSELQVEDGRLVAILGSHFSRPTKTVRNGEPTTITEHPRLSMSAGGQWEIDGYGDRPRMWYEVEKACIDAPSDPEAAWKSIHRETPMRNAQGDWFNQSVPSCAGDGDVLWGGITFYNAEGGWGVGGLVRQDRKSGAIEFERPPELRDESAGPLAWFDGTLWLGVTGFGECAGPPGGTGLKRVQYYPQSDFYTLKDVPEACGFAIRDFQEFGGALWVATDLGLSRLTTDGGRRWTNFMPDLEDPGLMREVGCDELYESLLHSDDLANTAGLDLGNAFDGFWRQLAILRPDFMRRYMRKLHGLPTKDYPLE